MYHSLSGSLTDGLKAVEREINALPTFVWGPSIITSTSFSKIWLPSLVYSLYHCGRPLKCKLCQWKESTFVKTKSLIPVTLGMSFHRLWVHTSRPQVKVIFWEGSRSLGKVTSYSVTCSEIPSRMASFLVNKTDTLFHLFASVWICICVNYMYSRE